MSATGGTVFLVDDEPGMLKALARLLEAEGFAVRAFTSAKTFLASYQADALGCVVLDVAMPELDGLELQQRLTQSGVLLPIVFLTGHGDIPMSVRAIKAGALDFLTKPVKDVDLLRAVRVALQRAVEQRELIRETALLRQRYSGLTPREREVMAHVVAGELNKQVADALGIGEHTVKVHRSHIMEKMGVPSLADLVRAAERLGLGKK
ncbi:MAG: response regulator [Accumulibacter sp.]|uniref:response regulator transcription factor n=1 Tax=Accumulibacter sp. TaxID=2053492 RepID=UPI003043125B